MQNSSQVNVGIGDGLLMTTPGSADQHEQHGDQESCRTKGTAATFRNNKYYRRLAICSILCGLSCIGIKALIYSVKAEHTGDKTLSQKAKKFSIISIMAWVCIIISIPILMGLVSFLLTLYD